MGRERTCAGDAVAARDFVRRRFVLALLTLVAACGEDGPTRIPLPPGVVRLPDYSPCPQPAPDIPCVYAGRAVFGTIHEDEGCIYMVLENGRRVRVVWPFGYSARLDPFVVYDNTGLEVARDGDELRPEGDGPLAGAPDECGMTSYVVLIDPVRRALRHDIDAFSMISVAPDRSPPPAGRATRVRNLGTIATSRRRHAEAALAHPAATCDLSSA